MEAWAYLVAQGLVAPLPEKLGQHFITRRGIEIPADADPLGRLSNEARIGSGLHPRIAGTVRQQFLLGEYELAAFAAMRAVEIRVRDLAGEPSASIGVHLMKTAFNSAGGALVDQGVDPGEREATMALFWGAIGVFKNPSSRRQVRFGAGGAGRRSSAPPSLPGRPCQRRRTSRRTWPSPAAGPRACPGGRGGRTGPPPAGFVEEESADGPSEYHHGYRSITVDLECRDRYCRLAEHLFPRWLHSARAGG